MKLLACVFLAGVLANASTLKPPILPLIVRNPYLSTWLQDAREKPWSQWPMFYTGESLGFAVMGKLNGSDAVYPMLGRPHDSLGDSGNILFPQYLGATFDASTTNLTYVLTENGNDRVEAVLSFLSPITPTSSLRQSIPATYLTVYVQGNLDVSIYIDINGQWVSGDRGAKITWDHGTKDHAGSGQRLKVHQFQRETQALFTEINDRSEWGQFYFIAPEDVHHEIGLSDEVRRGFARTGKLKNGVEQRFRGIMEEEPIFSYSKTFNLSGKNSVTNDSSTFTFAYIQEEVVQFASERGLTLMRPLWQSYLSTIHDVLTFHYSDFEDARNLAADYSAAVAKDAYASGSDEYKDIVELSARQVLGAIQFAGTPSNPLLFLKEISSDGNTQTIDVMFPAFPFFLYTNPDWLAWMMEPLLEHTLSGQYPNDYAMHDLGAHFPNATGHPDGRDEYMPVEECGNILIMGLALVNSLTDDATWAAAVSSHDDSEFTATANHSLFPLTATHEHKGIKFLDEPRAGSKRGSKQAKAWVSRSYKLWKQWTSYLVEYSLEPANQLSTDDFAGWLALQTNLALKGIIGIKAMAGLAKVVGEDADAEYYEKTAREYIAKWEDFAMSRDKTHAKLSYNWWGSWTTLYNLYADALLCFHLEAPVSNSSTSTSTSTSTSNHNPRAQAPLTHPSTAQGFVPRHIYKTQSNWYAAVRQKFGLPLDSRHLYTKSDWQIFAASVSSQAVRTDILQSIAYWVNETVTNRPLTDLYNTEGDGGFPGPDFFARPVVGGHFAPLTLERACAGKAMRGLRFLDEDSSSEELRKVRDAAAVVVAGKAERLDL